MSQADWKEFRNSANFGSEPFKENNVSYSELHETNQPPIPILATHLDNGGTVPKFRGRIYNGPDLASAFPSKHCSLSLTTASRTNGFYSISYRNTWGIFITPQLIGDDSLFETPVVDADIDMVMAGFFEDWGGSQDRQIWSRRFVDGVKVNGNEQYGDYIPAAIQLYGYRQIEVAFLLNDVIPGKEDFRIMYRYNNEGGAYTAPGGAGWTAWKQLAEYDYATEILGAGIDLSNGFYIGIGFYVESTSTEWNDTFGGNEYYVLTDDIRVTNFEAVPV